MGTCAPNNSLAVTRFDPTRRKKYIAMKQPSGKFANVPLDEDTRIKSQRQITVGGIDALHQVWVWDGLMGESVIFITEDIAHLSDDTVIRTARNAGFISEQTDVILKKSHDDFTFLNY